MASRFARFTRQLFGSSALGSARRPVSNRATPNFVQLEDRSVPATFVVTNILDSQTDAVGGLSLRKAILAANANPGFDRIEFNIPRSPSLPTIPGSPQQNYFPIQLATTLPDLTDPAGVSIDATTQPRNDVTVTRPIVQLLPNINLGAFPNDVGAFFITGKNNVIRGLVVTGFPGSAINLVGPNSQNNVIIGNWLNTDITGTKSWNQDPLILQARTGANVPDELTNAGPTPNSLRSGGALNAKFVLGGITLTSGANNNIIGGTTDSAGRILVDAGGRVIGDGGSLIISSTTGSTAVPVDVGINRNIISGTPEYRKDYFNFIGSDGGSRPRERDLTGAAVGPGIRIMDPGTSGNLVQGNFIGTDITGEVAIPNHNGIEIFNSATSNFIGNPVTPERGNLIRFNIHDGVRVASTPNPSKIDPPIPLGATVPPFGSPFGETGYDPLDFPANGVLVFGDSLPVFYDAYTPNYFIGGGGGGQQSIIDLAATDPANPGLTVRGAEVQVGATIRLNGTNLLGTSAVSFYANPAGTSLVQGKFRAIDDQTVEVTVPQGAVTGPIQVFSPSGVYNGLGVNGQTIVILPSPEPELDIVSAFFPSAATIGQTITIQGNNFNGTQQVLFNGQPASTFRILGNGTIIEAVVPVSATTGPIRIINPAGEAVTTRDFTILTQPPPVISSLSSPSSDPSTSTFRGLPGESVTITGVGFNGAFLVSFNAGAGSSGFSTTDFTVNPGGTQIVVRVPSFAIASVGPIRVQAAGGQTLSGNFQILTPAAPTATALSSGSGQVGSKITLTGTDLLGTDSVTVGGVAALFTVLGNSSIQITIPQLGASGTPSAIVVTTRGGTTAGLPYTVTPSPVPTVGNIPAAFQNTTVLVSGTGLLSTNRVLFGSANPAFGIPSQRVEVLSDTTLRILVPVGASTGQFFVFTAGGQAANGVTVSATTPPSISNAPLVSPVSGVIGTEVTINGLGLLGTQQVLFPTAGGGQVAASVITVDSDRTVRAIVPAGAVSGPVTIVTPGGQVQSAPYNVTASPLPGIVGIVPFPATGPVGTTVNITGSGFTGASSVTLGGRPVDGLNIINDTQLSFRVPALAPDGPVVITTAGGSATLPFNFVITPSPFPVINFSTPSSPRNSLVTINGSGLGGTTQVLFNDLSAAFTIVSDTELSATVPIGANPGLITVVTPGGRAVSPTQFDVSAANPPIVTSTFGNFGLPAQQAVTAPDAGVIGSKFFLNGSGLNSVFAVDVGGVDAKFVRTGGQILFTVPELAPGKYVVTVYASTKSKTDLGSLFGSTNVNNNSGTNFDNTQRTTTNVLGVPFVYGEQIEVLANARPNIISVNTRDTDGINPILAYRGAPLQIFGSGFTGANLVTIAGATITNDFFTVVSDQEIRVNVPLTDLPGSGAIPNADVTVTVPSLGSATNTALESNSMTINVAATPPLSFSGPLFGGFYGSTILITAATGSTFYGVDNISIASNDLYTNAFLGAGNATLFRPIGDPAPLVNFTILPGSNGTRAQVTIPSNLGKIPDAPAAPAGLTPAAALTITASTNAGDVTSAGTTKVARNIAPIINLNNSNGILNNRFTIQGSNKVGETQSLIGASSIVFEAENRFGKTAIVVQRNNFQVVNNGGRFDIVVDLPTTQSFLNTTTVWPTGGVTVNTTDGTATTTVTLAEQPVPALFEFQENRQQPQDNRIFGNAIYQNGALTSRDASGIPIQAQQLTDGNLGVDFVTRVGYVPTFPHTFGYARTDQVVLASVAGEFTGTGNHGRGGVNDGLINSFPQVPGSDSGLGAINSFNNVVGGRDYGPNLLQNFPLLQVVQSTADRTTFSTALIAKPFRPYRIEYYFNPGFVDQDPTALATSNAGYGQVFLGSKVVTTDSQGNGSVNFTINVRQPDASGVVVPFAPGEFRLPNNLPLPVGDNTGVVVATATDLSPVSPFGPSVTNGPDGTSRYSFFRRVDTSTASITGSVIFDANANGIIDPTESGVAGSTVSLFLDRGDGTFPALPNLTVTSDSSGGFTFGPVNGLGLPNGKHRITLDLPAASDTVPQFFFEIPSSGVLDAVSIVNGETVSGQNFLVTNAPPVVPPVGPPITPPVVPPIVPPIVPPVVPPVVPPPPFIPGAKLLAVGADAGGSPLVNVYNQDGSFRYQFAPYGADFSGGVRVAVGDLTGDGLADIVTAPGAGIVGVVNVYEGSTGALLNQFIPYESTFTGGVYVATGDVDGDGIQDIITGTGVGGGPRVQIFRGGTYETIANFFPYEFTFTGGVLVAAGDVNGDGRADIITGTGVGGGPRVQVFDGSSLAEIYNFFAYEIDFRGGVFASVGDVNGDGLAEIITGTGIGGGPVVKVFDQATLNARAVSPNGIASFFAYAPEFRGGVRVDSIDGNNDGRLDIVTSPGFGGGPDVRVIDFASLQDIYRLQAFDPNFLGGVFVGGSH